MAKSFYSLSARKRISALCDESSFVEICLPSEEFISPHLKKLGLATSFDDGVVIGVGKVSIYRVIFISQDSTFYGGAVGEIHGAKIKGILDCALKILPDAVLFLIDSGGVRLQEANAGLIGLSEIIKSTLEIRNKGIPVIAIIGGSCGAFGGMGIYARLCSEIIITEKGKIGLSGPEVIETVKGADEFNSHNKDMIIKTVGARARKDIGEVKILVKDDVDEIKKAVLEIISDLKTNKKSFFEEVFHEHQNLKRRLMD